MWRVQTAGGEFGVFDDITLMMTMMMMMMMTMVMVIMMIYI